MIAPADMSPRMVRKAPTPSSADCRIIRSTREIAEIVARTFPGCELTVGESGGDTRSYRVSFAKIRAHMPEFETAWTAERGARQLKAVFERIGLDRLDAPR